MMMRRRRVVEGVGAAEASSDGAKIARKSVKRVAVECISVSLEKLLVERQAGEPVAAYTVRVLLIRSPVLGVVRPALCFRSDRKPVIGLYTLHCR